jgi:hypothetical protein
MKSTLQLVALSLALYLFGNVSDSSNVSDKKAQNSLAKQHLLSASENHPECMNCDGIPR